MWLIFTMNGIRCAYLRDTDAEHAERRGHRVAAALDRELDDVRGSKYFGFGANDAAAECSMPWSTGRIDT